ncbi:hypothetical protein B0H13DRAFT_1860926 [Mycena leptocephala]|nr:hypothetical protein B0H13DRAFT_1860926 [Mycena leptocephala]
MKSGWEGGQVKMSREAGSVVLLRLHEGRRQEGFDLRLPLIHKPYLLDHSYLVTTKTSICGFAGPIRKEFRVQERHIKRTQARKIEKGELEQLVQDVDKASMKSMIKNFAASIWARNRWNTASKPGWSSGAENRQTEQPQEKLEAVNWDSDRSGTKNRDQITGRLRHDRTFKTLNSAPESRPECTSCKGIIWTRWRAQLQHQTAGVIATRDLDSVSSTGKFSRWKGHSGPEHLVVAFTVEILLSRTKGAGPRTCSIGYVELGGRLGLENSLMLDLRIDTVVECNEMMVAAGTMELPGIGQLWRK